jgi:hypothetical protein
MRPSNRTVSLYRFSGSFLWASSYNCRNGRGAKLKGLLPSSSAAGWGWAIALDIPALGTHALGTHVLGTHAMSDTIKSDPTTNMTVRNRQSIPATPV